MKIDWLERLMADRGVHGKIVRAEIVARDADVMLDVTTHATDDAGKMFVVFAGGDDGVERRVAIERHLLPIGGMVFDV